MKFPNGLTFSIFFSILFLVVFTSPTAAYEDVDLGEEDFGDGFVGTCKIVTDTDPDIIGNQPGVDCTVTAPDNYPADFTETVGEDTFFWSDSTLKKFEVLEEDKKFRYVWYVSGWDLDGNYNPYFSEGPSTTRSITENTGAGAAIGSPVSATSLRERDTLTYSLSGTDASSFSIDSSTGQLRTATSLDYETKNTYSVTVIVSGDCGGAKSIDVTINITKISKTVAQQPPTGGQQPDDTQQPQQSDDTQQSQQPDDTQQNVNNRGGSGGGGGDSTQPVKPEEPVNHTIKPFDYEGEGVGKVVLSEWMMSKLDSAPQWIELYNTTDESITLQGWKLVGRSMNSDGKVSVLKTRTIPTLTLKSKKTCVVVAFPVRSSQYYSPNLRRRIYSLRASNEWSSQGIVLELQDEYGTPIDRIGNLSDQDEVRWDIPDRIHQSVGSNGKRVSFIRRLRSQKSREYNFRFGMTKFGWFAADEVEKLTESKRSKYFYGHPTDIGTPGYRTEGVDPLPVTLSSFIAQVAEGGQVVLSWTTASEIENAGFNIFRSESKEGPFKKVNSSIIQGAGTTSERNAYQWIDTTARANIAYYYRIADVSFDGISKVLTTQRLKGIFTAKNRSLTRWAILKKEAR